MIHHEWRIGYYDGACFYVNRWSPTTIHWERDPGTVSIPPSPHSHNRKALSLSGRGNPTGWVDNGGAEKLELHDGTSNRSRAQPHAIRGYWQRTYAPLYEFILNDAWCQLNTLHIFSRVPGRCSKSNPRVSNILHTSTARNIDRALRCHHRSRSSASHRQVTQLDLVLTGKNGWMFAW